MGHVRWQHGKVTMGFASHTDPAITTQMLKVDISNIETNECGFVLIKHHLQKWTSLDLYCGLFD